jgi:hypothetical protein
LIIGIICYNNENLTCDVGCGLVGLFLIASALTAYFAMNFTGCSTFTSLSGVQKEMRIAVPVIILSIVSGGAALLMG